MRDGTGSRLIHIAVARHAARTPDAPALLHGEQWLTYRELDRAADAYAVELRRRGVGPGALVPVALDRTPRLVAVLLGVLKCGAGYAALDTAWPRERLRTVVAALAPPVAVGKALAGCGAPTWDHVWTPTPIPAKPPTGHTPPSTGHRPPHTPPSTGNRPPHTPPPPPTGQRHPHTPLSEYVADTAPATVFFTSGTSGTSGTSKPVLSPHRATTRLFRPGAPLVGLGPGRVMAQAAPVPWDAFSLEVWGPLLSGAACAMSGSRTLLPDELRELIVRHGVDTLWITSSLLNLFIDEDPDCFAGLTHVLTGGEVLSPPHIRAFLRRHPQTALFNGYGPVESCVFATLHRITPADCDRPDGIPVGTPVPDTDVHLVDGEIHVSGDGLASGYLGLPEATAERFVERDGVRVYRTGDLGRLDAEGVLHFRGRTDRQVKIAGHRVEPAEIEAAARRVPGVRDCAALPTGDRLALYYTAGTTDTASAPDTADRSEPPLTPPPPLPSPPPPLTPATMRRALRALLPPYLVPHLVRELPALPVTANGKVDRPALAAGSPR